MMQPPGKSFVLVLTTSAHADDAISYAAPIRNLGEKIIRGFVVKSETDTTDILDRYGRNAEFIFYDIEKKSVPISPGSEFNLERYFVGSEFKLKSIPFKPNDITVSAVFDNLSNSLGRRGKGLGGLRVCLAGVGNIGFKTALSLVESGVDVTLVSRSFEKAERCANTINEIKPSATLAVADAAQSVSALPHKQDALITCASESAIIQRKHLENVEDLKFVLDVGKKNLSSDAVAYLIASGIRVQRLSVTDALVKYIAGALHILEYGSEPVGAGVVKGRNVVSGGMLGRKGDWIVDDYRNPIRWLGIADGEGGFMRRITDE